jgi:folate-dependent phosphoribosylglycinamide formyltransferase PurN
MEQVKIMLLAIEGDATNILYHKLSEEANIAGVLIEQPVSRSFLLFRRIQKLGLLKVIGQLLFIPATVLLKLVSNKRIQEILKENNLSVSSIPGSLIKKVDNVNSEQAVAYIKEIAPELIIVSGTRIISKDVLNAVKVKFINIHTGITPLYRGVHGGYWALTMRDPVNCGVSVHLIDAGIDTGQIIEQARIFPTPKDNFITYPYLQLSKGIELLQEIQHQYRTTKVFKDQKAPLGRSKLWSHPTLFEYLYFRLVKGVK